MTFFAITGYLTWLLLFAWFCFEFGRSWERALQKKEELLEGDVKNGV